MHIYRIGSSVAIFSRDSCDVQAVGTVRFPWEKRATTSAKSQRRASMMRRDTGATGKNARSRPLFSATAREDNGISLTLFARPSHTTAINRIDMGFVSKIHSIKKKKKMEFLMRCVVKFSTKDRSLVKVTRGSSRVHYNVDRTKREKFYSQDIQPAR